MQMASYEQSPILDSSKTCPTLPTPQQYNNQNKGWKNQDQTKDSLKIFTGSAWETGGQVSVTKIK